MSDHLTPADLERMRAEHVKEVVPALGPTPELAFCLKCWAEGEGDSDWPCDVARLLAELDRRNGTLQVWQQRIAAGVGYGLLGPATAEELQ